MLFKKDIIANRVRWIKQFLLIFNIRSDTEANNHVPKFEEDEEIINKSKFEYFQVDWVYRKYDSCSDRRKSIDSEELTSSLSSSENSNSKEAYEVRVNDKEDDNISIENIVNLSKSNINFLIKTINSIVKRKTLSWDLADDINNYPSISIPLDGKQYGLGCRFLNCDLDNPIIVSNNKPNIIMENEELNTESNEEALMSGEVDQKKSSYAHETIDSETESLPNKFKHIMPIESILVMPWKRKSNI